MLAYYKIFLKKVAYVRHERSLSTTCIYNYANTNELINKNFHITLDEFSPVIGELE